MVGKPKKLKYPPLDLTSKYDLTRKLISRKRSFEEAKKLTVEAEREKDLFWFDHQKMSKPDEEKFVRCVKRRSGLYLLLKKINGLVGFWDNLLPINIYGGRTNKSSTEAAASLLINQNKNRYLLKTDLSHFFEQVEKGRIFSFFKNRCGCSKNASDFMANLCVVPKGKKGTIGTVKVLARGFSPSTRLATWCNIEFFYKLVATVRSHFKHTKTNPRIIIYVDDIFIAASDTSEQEMHALKVKVLNLAEKFAIEVNEKKTKVFLPSDQKEQQEALGLVLKRRYIALPLKWQQKMSRLKQEKKGAKNTIEKKKIKLKINGLYLNKDQVEKANKKLKEIRQQKTKP